jgi:hypothetical protein
MPFWLNFKMGSFVHFFTFDSINRIYMMYNKNLTSSGWLNEQVPHP